VRSYAITCLESLGYKVLTAANGREALAHIKSGAKVDVLFTDLVMPGGISGWELSEQAKKIVPGLKVLMTSGYPLETLAARGHKRANGGNILNKPYRKAELARRLREVLDMPVAEAE
jgi:CheY-like chemotaxis protein